MKKFIKERDILFKLFVLLPFIGGTGFIFMYAFIFDVSLITKNPLMEFSMVGPLFMMLIYAFAFNEAYKERNKTKILLFVVAQSQMVITVIVAICIAIWMYFTKKPVLDKVAK
jgi:uncharacterized membrane protein YbaN (DUF454 family)